MNQLFWLKWSKVSEIIADFELNFLKKQKIVARFIIKFH